MPSVLRACVLLAAVLALVPATALAAPGSRCELGDYRVLDGGQVYYGNARLVRSPCTISADRIYQSIPEYREILEQGLTDKDVRYHFLMKKASERFARAVKEMARAEGYDLVVEAGAIVPAKEGVPDAPDRTADVIGRLT
jgi:hypothetical protein